MHFSDSPQGFCKRLTYCILRSRIIFSTHEARLNSYRLSKYFKITKFGVTCFSLGHHNMQTECNNWITLLNLRWCVCKVWTNKFTLRKAGHIKVDLKTGLGSCDCSGHRHSDSSTPYGVVMLYFLWEWGGSIESHLQVHRTWWLWFCQWLYDACSNHRLTVYLTWYCPSVLSSSISVSIPSHRLANDIKVNTQAPLHFSC